jgi:transcriptional regulator with XRE-family HTH domain
MNIKKLRKEKNMTQIELAAKVGVSLTTIRNWEYGASTPNEENMKKLEEILENE